MTPAVHLGHVWQETDHLHLGSLLLTNPPDSVPVSFGGYVLDWKRGLQCFDEGPKAHDKAEKGKVPRDSLSFLSCTFKKHHTHTKKILHMACFLL